MKINVPDIASTLTDLGIPFESQSNYLVAAVARVLGYLLPIPAAAVEGPACEFFKSAYTENLTKALDALNERMPVDYLAVADLTQKIWEVRYSLVHPTREVQAWTLIDGCIDKAHIGFEVNMADPALQRLGAVIAEGVVV